MVRDLIDDWKRLRRRLRHRPQPAPAVSATLVCAEMIGDTLGDLIDHWAALTGADVDLIQVRNRFFGSRVRVSGLLTGGDILTNADSLRGDVIILPTVMLDKTGSRTLDGLSPAELEQRLGKPVRFAGYLSEVDAVVRAEERMGTLPDGGSMLLCTDSRRPA